MQIHRTKLRAFEIIRFIALFALGIVFLYPFFLMVMISLDNTANYGLEFPPHLLPKEFGFKNYDIIFQSLPIGKYYLNSLIVVGGSTFFHLAGATLAGFALSKGEFRGKNFWMLMILAAMMIPDQVIVFTRFLIFNSMNLSNNFVGVILPTLAWPFGVFLVKQFMDTLPKEFGEASRIDGANSWTIFSKVYLPLAAPVVATMAILTVMQKWNELLWPLLMISKASMYTVAIGVANFTLNMSGGIIIGNSLALASLTIIPIVILFILLQKYIIQSVAAAGIKQ